MALLLEIIFALLFIVLFFKVWGMTNDVNKISGDVRDILNKRDDSISLASNAFSVGNKEAVKVFLDSGVYGEISALLNKTISISYSSSARNICNEYRRYYNLYKIEQQPDWDGIIDKKTAVHAIENLIPKGNDSVAPDKSDESEKPINYFGGMRL
ncbi:MAG: hypothetical protein ACRC9P_03200 [Bacteroides sp.]